MTEFPDDGLRARLARIDPAGPTAPVDPFASPRAAALMERAMQSTEIPPAVTALSAARRRRRPLLLFAAAAVAAAAAAVGFGVVGDGGGAAVDRPTTLALTLPAPDPTASCIVFDVTALRQAPVAFAGTATDVRSDRVTLDVDRWYKGGDDRGGHADRVTLAVPDEHSSAALDGIDFHAGERYLVTASEGTVNGCGFSGPATPQLEAAFTAAFGG